MAPSAEHPSASRSASAPSSRPASAGVVRAAAPRPGSGGVPRLAGLALLPLLVAATAGALSGCASTQQKSARAQVIASRTLLGREQLRVTRRDSRVEVRSVATVRDAHRVAFVVRLRNRSAEPVNDLPVAVGVRPTAGRRRLFNGRPGLPYWQTHGPAIAPGASATLVVVVDSDRPPRGTPFATVGRTDRRPTVAATLPAIEVGARADAAGPADTGRRVKTVVAEIRNRSDVPQYGLEIYAVARRGGRVVAAGRVPLAHLGSNARATASVPLIGDPRGARIRLSTSPTLFS